jgi:hypothetical protein
LLAPVFNLTKKYRELIKSAMDCLILPTFTKIASEPETLPFRPHYIFSRKTYVKDDARLNPQVCAGGVELPEGRPGSDQPHTDPID